MRKVLSFVLVLSLVLGSLGMAFAAAPLSDVAGEKSEDAVKVLTQLGVVSGYPDGTYKPGNIVTRAEMAVIVVRALGLADYAAGTANFKDMAGHWSNPYVAYAASLGIIAGYTDGTFKPDKTVSYDEAATMLVAALGYNTDSLTGTWPANFVVKAKSLGILDGIKAGAAGANRGDIAIMAFQTLDAKIGTTDKDGKWTANDPEDNMIARLGAELYNDGDAFVINGDEDSVVNLKPFLGAYVTAYQNDDDEIIAIKEVKSVFLTGEYDPDENTFETDSVTYNVASNLITIVHPEAVAFVNGEVTGAGATVSDGKVTGFDFGDANPALADEDLTVAAKVSGKRITELYSVAAWDRTDAFLYKTDMLEDDNLNGHDFALDNNDEIDLTSFELIGIDSLDDLEKDNVVYVYVNKTDKEITRVAVGTEVVTGEITKINASSKKITVDGKVYEMYDGSAFSFKLNDEVELSLDYAGDVYDADTVKSQADSFAVLLETSNGTTGLDGKDGLVKLFLADGTDKIFTVDDDLVVTGVIAKNGVWNNGAGDTTDYVGKAAAGTVVEYGLDKNGVLDSLKVITLGSKVNEKEMTSKGYYNGKAVNSDAVLFTYDGDDKSDEDNYGVTTVAKVTGKDLTAKYALNSSGKINVMVIEDLGGDDEDVFGVVVGRSITSASDTDYQLTVWVDGKKVDYDVTKAIYDEFAAKTKDYVTVYKLEFNASDAIKGLEKASGDEIILDWTEVVKYSSGTLSVGAEDNPDEYTIDTSGYALKINSDKDAYEDKASINNSALKGNKVMLFDTDEDGVADLILIGQPK